MLARSFIVAMVLLAAPALALAQDPGEATSEGDVVPHVFTNSGTTKVLGIEPGKSALFLLDAQGFIMDRVAEPKTADEKFLFRQLMGEQDKVRFDVAGLRGGGELRLKTIGASVGGEKQYVTGGKLDGTKVSELQVSEKMLMMSRTGDRWDDNLRPRPVAPSKVSMGSPLKAPLTVSGDAAKYVESHPEAERIIAELSKPNGGDSFTIAQFWHRKTLTGQLEVDANGDATLTVDGKKLPIFNAKEGVQIGKLLAAANGKSITVTATDDERDGVSGIQIADVTARLTSTKAVPIYSDASASSGVMKTIRPGQTVKVLGPNWLTGDQRWVWVQVGEDTETAGAETGWMRADAIAIDNASSAAALTRESRRSDTPGMDHLLDRVDAEKDRARSGSTDR